MLGISYALFLGGNNASLQQAALSGIVIFSKLTQS
jgi:hypothetical protein